MTADAIADAFRQACRAELQALKPGNVHIHADGHGMTVADFEASSEAAAPYIAMAGASVGARIFGAVRATRDRVGQNTNLGIVLLCAPLAAARQATPTGDLREALRTVLAGLTVHDATLAYLAITLANPGGLGEGGQHDVRQPPRITLLEAMRLAGAQDRIAHQFVTAYADIFDTALPLLEADAGDAANCAKVYWHFLTHFPDSHVARKYGLWKAEEMRNEALAIDAQFRDIEDVAAQQKRLLDFDIRLKTFQINPGTSADLSVATLFSYKLQRFSE
jgi:triphosphoribosyl-dephospho-CoA synthase